MGVNISVPHNDVYSGNNCFFIADGDTWNFAAVGILQNQSGCYLYADARLGDQYWQITFEQVPEGSVHRFGLMEINVLVTQLFIDGESLGYWGHFAYPEFWNSGQGLCIDTRNGLDGHFTDLSVVRNGRWYLVTPGVLANLPERTIVLLGEDMFLYTSLQVPYYCFDTHTGCLHAGGAYPAYLC